VNSPEHPSGGRDPRPELTIGVVTPAQRPDDQEGFDEGMRISMKSMRRVLDRRRKNLMVDR
jgi:hypothetical protein